MGNFDDIFPCKLLTFANIRVIMSSRLKEVLILYA